MEWIDIMIKLLASLGGVAGIISLYQARPKKDALDIANIKTVIDEVQELYEKEHKDNQEIRASLRESAEREAQNVVTFHKEIESIQAGLTQTRNEVSRLKKSIYRAYRCKYPQTAKDCPVLDEYEKQESSPCITQCLPCDETA